MANVKHTPIELQKKHYTKSELEERKNTTLQVDKLTKCPQAPSYLNEEQKKIFKKVAKQLIEANLMTVLDIDTVARYSILQDSFIQLNKQISEEPTLLLDDKILNKQIKLSKEIQTLSNVLCLNIVARSKVVVNNIEKEVEKKPEPINKFSVFLGCDDDE